jgi:hypothetical protein
VQVAVTWESYLVSNAVSLQALSSSKQALPFAGCSTRIYNSVDTRLARQTSTVVCAEL